MRKFYSLLAATSCLAAVATAPMAVAQTAPADDEAAKEEDIVVIGTLIRGIEANGAQTIGVDAEDISSKGALSTSELLSLVPQITVGGGGSGRFEGDPRGIKAGNSINKPNLRSLPGANSTSGGTTLVLVDGFRATPVGVNQSAIDVDIIPAAVIAGMDVVTSGSSSLYGADAVSGVVNFRTLKEFNGVKVDANYGLGSTIKGFRQWDAQLTAGTSWSTGNAYISGGYSHRDLVLNNETDWATGEIYNALGVPRFTGTLCNSPVGTETRWFRTPAAPGGFTNNPRAPGAGPAAIGTACDNVSANTYSPLQKRYNVYGALTQEFSDTISLRMTAYYTKRDTELGEFPRGFTSAGSGITTAAELNARFPNAQASTPIGGLFAVTEGIGFSFAPNAAYVNTRAKLGFETWGVTPELTVELGRDWQVRATAHFGRSTNFQSFPSVNAPLAQSYINAGQLDPRNVATASAAVINDITDFVNDQDTKQQLFVTRVVADGPIMELPGGEAKVAVGLEYQDNKASSRLVAGRFNALDALPFSSYDRNSKSAFAELSLPIMDFLTVSGSVRYDDYSDFGSTTNPGIGATLKPAEWLKIYGHWNKSFNAPTALDGLGIATGRFACGIYTVGLGSASRPNDPPPVQDNGQGTCALVTEGVKAGIGPQTAESWSAGFEIKPTDSLRFGGEFYSIDFNNVLAAVDPTNLNTYLTNPDLYLYAITDPAYRALLGQLTNGAALLAQRPNTDIAIVVDRRTSNLGSAKIEGVDFHINYEANIGSSSKFFTGLSGTRATKSIQNFGVLSDVLGLGGPKTTAIFHVGVKSGGFSHRTTINHFGKYRDSGINSGGISGETVNPFTFVNMNFGYEFGDGSGALSGTALRFTVDNLFAEKPQRIKRGAANVQTYNNWTLGTVFKFGISKKF